MQFAQSVGETDERPLAAHFIDAAEAKLTEATGVFDLPEDWLNDHLSPSTQGVKLARNNRLSLNKTVITSPTSGVMGFRRRNGRRHLEKNL